MPAMSGTRAPDALVFDLDGTLWDTCAPCAAAWNRVLARLGIRFREITAADVRAVAGQPPVRALARRNGFTRAWLVGDTEGDRHAAGEAGLRFVHARYGFGRVAAADNAIERFADLDALLGIAS